MALVLYMEKTLRMLVEKKIENDLVDVVLSTHELLKTPNGIKYFKLIRDK